MPSNPPPLPVQPPAQPKIITTNRVVGAIFVAVILGYTAFHMTREPLPELTRPEFLTEILDGHVSKVVIEDGEVITGVSSTQGEFRTAFHKPQDAGLADELRRRGVEVVESVDHGLFP